jgi:hypothetical protein
MRSRMEARRTNFDSQLFVELKLFIVEFLKAFVACICSRKTLFLHAFVNCWKPAILAIPDITVVAL